MLVVDLMHEFELGVWKSTFTHLVRLLYAAAPGGSLVTELDRRSVTCASCQAFFSIFDLTTRFRLVPTFGHGTIRRFSANASEMKKLAARNFEDMLQVYWYLCPCDTHSPHESISQCAIPVFEGLLPEPHNEIVLTLLFRLAEWHALAKLRMHTESTLTLLESVTTTLGYELRRFRATTCSVFFTTELPKEAAARQRKRGQKAKAAPKVPTLPAQASTSSSSKAPEGSSSLPTTGPPPKKQRRKTFNLSIYKVHALGDYAHTVRLFGPTDSYSTQTVCLVMCFFYVMNTDLDREGELEHRRVKRLYGRTNKNRAIKQMTKHERRETRLLRARRAATSQQSTTHPHHVAFSEQDPLPYTDAALHHISDSKKHGQDAFSFGRLFPNDPATKVRPPTPRHLQT